MDINVEVSKQLSYIDELLSNFGERIASCKNNEKKKEETQMPDSTTNTEKNNTILFSCGDDVLLANKDGKYYLGTIVEVSTSNDNDSSDVESDDPQFLIKFGDGTHAWASISQLKQLSAPPADDGRIMCVVCKGREATSGSAPNGVIACDMCGRGYHGRCHSPPIVAWVNGASWHCKRCVDQRYKVAAAENRAQKRSDMLRFKGGQQRRPQQDLTPPCDTISISSAEEPIEIRGSGSSDKKCMKAKVRASSSSDKKSLKAKDRGSNSSDKRSVKTKDRCSSSSDKKSVKTKDRCSSRSDKKSVKTKDRCSSSSDKKSVKTKTASSSAVNSQHVANDLDLHCYCDEKKDYLAQMLQCCRCSRWFHQRCVSSLRFPLYAGDKLYIFACATCNGGSEYLRRLELCWLELAHLALYNLTAYNAPNYFDLDKVIMPYIIDNWRALQLPEKMWRTPAIERREQILTALTSSRKRFKCGREMKKRATIWGLRLRRPPPPPSQLGNLEQLKKGVPLTDEIVREHSPRLRFLPREPYPPPETEVDDSTQPSSSQLDKISPYTTDDQGMIVPVDSEWLNLMMGKRFHENICNNPYSENDSNSTCSYESPKQTEVEEQPSPSQPSVSCSARESDTKADKIHETNTTNEATPICESPPVPSLVQCKVNLNNLSKDVSTLETSCVSEADTSGSKDNACTININSHSSRIATMNLEVSKQSTKNIIEQSKIMSLQHMGRFPAYTNGLFLELDSSGDEASKRGTLDTFIPPLKDFHGINNPFLMQFKHSSKGVSSKQNGKHCNGRFSLPMQFNPMMAPFARTVKRKLSEKDIIIGPNGEVKRRKFRRPRKYLQDQLNKSCPLPEDSKSVSTFTSPEIEMPAPKMKNDKRVKFQGRRLRERKEKNYYEKSRRNNTNNFNNTNNTINSVKSLQLSPHKGNNSTVDVDAQQLSVLKTTVQSYFRARSTFKILARRKTTGAQPAYLIEWDTTS